MPERHEEGGSHWTTWAETVCASRSWLRSHAAGQIYLICWSCSLDAAPNKQKHVQDVAPNKQKHVSTVPPTTDAGAASLPAVDQLSTKQQFINDQESQWPG
jgi:hypothetical protein